MSAKHIALEYAKDIVVSKVTNSTEPTYKESGEQVADFFEAVYNKIYEIAIRED